MTALPVALTAWLVLSNAEASPPPPRDEVAEAHRRFQRATELFEENNLAGALAEFRRAYSIAPTYKILYNIGQLCYLLQDFPCAFDSLTRYLGQGGNEVSGPRREEVQRDLARLQPRVAKLRILADQPGAEVTVDNVSVGRTPLSDPVLVVAGRPQIRVTLAGHVPVTRVVEVAGMDTATVEVQLALADPTAPPTRAEPVVVAAAPTAAPREARAPTPVFPWIATGVLAAGAGTTGALALWSSSDLEKKRGQVPADEADLDRRSRRTRGLAIATDVLLGATVVAAGVATYLTITRPARRESFAVSVGPGSVEIAGSF